MKEARWLLAGLALAGVLTLGVACDTGATKNTAAENTGGGAGANPIDTIDTSGFLGTLSSPEVAGLARSFASTFGQVGSSQQAGIWVTGYGTVTLTPDLALLSLGVETRAKTVGEARREAATAMAGIIDALKARGVAVKDIRTSYFNISPEYTYQEVRENGYYYSKQVLTGYLVTNNVTAKVRDMEILGVTIDEVAETGGDATRIQSIQFIVDDPAAAQVQAREEAILDALSRAKQFATLTGATLGNLVYIAESGGSIPVAQDYAYKAMASGAAESAPTPISAGELELQVYVQAVFAVGTP
ncbi:MAG: hypothetical protein HW388_1680 [Dehalococcoidia bacterium]|nr:hypothetical protein [Dehalococcoidia bacterium]